ncbi:MAG: hypothetical protein RLZZ387_319 [Chloroflexota bacterium]|jgi:hypothetical protein
MDGPQYKTLGLGFPALAITPNGRPRVVVDVSYTSDSQGLHYLACDQGCTERAGWSAVRLAERGSGTSASWDLELDAAGNPRLILNQGSTADVTGNQLYFAWCNAGCFDAEVRDHRRPAGGRQPERRP